MKVFGIHDNSGCGWYRVRLPFDELAKRGHDVRYQEGLVDRAALDGYPLVVGQRMDKPEALPIWRRLRAQAKLVYEIDDDVFRVDPVNWMAHRVYSQPVPRDTVAHAAEVADLVTVTTEPLAEVMRELNGNVAVLPNHVPAELLGWDRPRRDRVTVGWAGGASHGADMQMVASHLRRFLRRNPAADLHLIGTDYRQTVRAPARFTDWSADIWAYYRTIDFDIGLAPLVDTPFSRSKSAIKAMEYAALGIPVVASDVDAYRPFVLDGVTGFLVAAEHEWGKRLYELANDAPMREEMGRKAREHAAAWASDRGAELWERAYGPLLGEGTS
jgi:glycosyltransferase involved in cell wall biosynthesis